MTTFLKRAGLLMLVLAVLAFALVGLLTVTRGTPVSTVLAIDDRGRPPAPGDSLFVETMELFSAVHLDPVNSVEVLENGDGTYPRLWRDLASARETITVQMYFSKPGVVADSMAMFLRDRARAGVRVLLLLDAFGSGSLKNGWSHSLRAAGVRVAWLRPVHWYSLSKANNRSHVRAIVVDGRVGYTGGFGLADYWQGDGRHDEQWRETNARFTGPVVMQLQAMFAEGWAEATGELLVGDVFFPRATFHRPTGTTHAGILHAMPTTGSTNGERFMAVSIASARKRLYITNSYFVPDDDFRRLLVAAAKRGVDVRVLTAGDKTDVKTTTYAGRARYEELLRGGVRIYEYRPTMMHAKSLVADGVWGSIGSLNFDNRSLAFNNESNVVTLDATLGAAMDTMFLHDLQYADEQTLDKVRNWPWTEKALTFAANLLSRLL
jgi:cardiolipin synthase A/B